MNGGAYFMVAIIPVIVVLVVMAVRAGKKAGLKRNAELREMAARLGLQYTEQAPSAGFLPPSPSVAGMFSGRQARLREFTRGSGKNRTRWVAAHVQCTQSNSLKLTLRTQHMAIFEKIAEVFGYKDIVVGDLAFDSLLAVRGNDEAFIKAALIPEIRTRIVAFWPKKLGSRITVDNGEVVYEQQGSFGNAQCRESLEEAFPVLTDMAAIAEVHGA